MALAVVLREDFDGAGLRRLARLSGDANQVRRLLALAVIYDGGARRAAAEVGGVGLQTVRDWVLRFNANGPEGLLDGKAPGVNGHRSFPDCGRLKFPGLAAGLISVISRFGDRRVPLSAVGRVVWGRREGLRRDWRAGFRG
jgi:hypothetical protein